MRRTQAGAILAMGLAVFGISAASAQVDAELNIKNLKNSQQSKSITASAGEVGKFTWTKNLSRVTGPAPAGKSAALESDHRSVSTLTSIGDLKTLYR